MSDRRNYRAMNEQMVRVLNTALDRSQQAWITVAGVRISQQGHFYIARAYGQPRLQMIVGQNGAERDISPRLSNKELYLWLSGMLQGAEYGKSFISMQF